MYDRNINLQSRYIHPALDEHPQENELPSMSSAGAFIGSLRLQSLFGAVAEGNDPDAEQPLHLSQNSFSASTYETESFHGRIPSKGPPSTSAGHFV